MSLETHSHIACACPPSHRLLRHVLSAIIVVLVLSIVGTLTYLTFTGGFES